MQPALTLSVHSFSLYLHLAQWRRNSSQRCFFTTSVDEELVEEANPSARMRTHEWDSFSATPTVGNICHCTATLSSSVHTKQPLHVSQQLVAGGCAAGDWTHLGGDQRPCLGRALPASAAAAAICPGLPAGHQQAPSPNPLRRQQGARTTTLHSLERRQRIMLTQATAC